MKRLLHKFGGVLCLAACSIFALACSEDGSGCLGDVCGEVADAADASGSSPTDPVVDGADSSTTGDDPSEPMDESVSCESPEWVPLFDSATLREPDVQEETSEALITRLADRARDRHAREDIVNGGYFENMTIIFLSIGNSGLPILKSLTGLLRGQRDYREFHDAGTAQPG